MTGAYCPFCNQYHQFLPFHPEAEWLAEFNCSCGGKGKVFSGRDKERKEVIGSLGEYDSIMVEKGEASILLQENVDTFLDPTSGKETPVHIVWWRLRAK